MDTQSAPRLNRPNTPARFLPEVSLLLPREHGAWAIVMIPFLTAAAIVSGGTDNPRGQVTRAPKGSSGRTEVYGWFLRGGLQTAGELGRPLESTGIFTVGLRRVSAPQTGFRYKFENAWQFGERGPDSHNSVMLVGNAGHVWDKFWKPLLQIEYAFARGDNDPADGNSNEFHNLFPTNHLTLRLRRPGRVAEHS